VNVTGMSQYSKETASIRDPKKLMDSHQKLIFIYPMLFADKIKVQNIQSFETLMRDFIAVTFLSDMFIQNLFSVIGTASQIRPLWDEKNQSVDPTTGIIRAMAAQQGIYYTGGISPPNYPVGGEHSMMLQQKISQKTAIIQRLIKTDPKMAKLRPYIEIITMGNMIEIPVIVGTFLYPVDTLTLMYVLLAAIGLNRKLSNTQDLDIIFKELESMDKAKYWALLSNLIRTPTDHQTMLGFVEKQTFKALHKVSGWNKFLPRSVTSAAGNKAAALQKRINNPPELEQQEEMFAPLLLKSHDLDQTKLYFKFVLDSKFAKDKFGIDTSDEASKLEKLSSIKLSGKLKAVHRVTMGGFAELIGSLGSSLLRSVVNLISTDNSSVDYAVEKTQIIDIDMLKNIEPILQQILLFIDKGLSGGSVEEARNKIDIMKSLCEIDTSKHLKDFIEHTVENSVLASDFSQSKFKGFIQFFDEFSNVSKSMALQLENEIKFITSNREIDLNFNNLENVINQSLDDFFKPFKADLNEDKESPLARVMFNDGNNKQQINDRLIPKFITGLTNIFYFALFAKLQMSLCQFVLTADVDLEMTKNEVTTWPNYTLVLPVEVVLALHAALMGMSWEHLLKGGQLGESLRTKTVVTTDSLTGTRITTEKNKALTKEQVAKSTMADVSENYIKPAIKYICNRLDVPNIIVVDAKRGEIYYKLMNQIDTNKTKISTIDTFIQSKLNRQITQQY